LNPTQERTFRVKGDDKARKGGGGQPKSEEDSENRKIKDNGQNQVQNQKREIVQKGGGFYQKVYYEETLKGLGFAMRLGDLITQKTQLKWKSTDRKKREKSTVP